MTNHSEGWFNNLGQIIMYLCLKKIKGVKARVKVWNEEQFGDSHQKIVSIEKDLNKLETEGDERQLSENEVLTRKKL